MEEFGWNLSQGEDPYFDSHSPPLDLPVPATVLIVEDNLSDVNLLKIAFQEHRLDLQIQNLSNGGAAIDWIERIDAGHAELPVLLLLDINLPLRSGFEVLEHWNRSPRCAHVPVIVLSSSSAPRDRTIAENLGAARYISKPADIDEFMLIGEVVKAVLHEKRAER